MLSRFVCGLPPISFRGPFVWPHASRLSRTHQSDVLFSLSQSLASDAFCGVPFQTYLRSPHFLLGLVWPSRDANLTYMTKQKYFVQPRLRLQELGARFPQSDVGPDSGRGGRKWEAQRTSSCCSEFLRNSRRATPSFSLQAWRTISDGPLLARRNGQGHIRGAVRLVELFGPLRARIDGRIRTTAHRLIAEGDYVVVEARGSNTTKRGATVQ